MYRVGQRANAGDFDIEFDTAKIKEKYRDDPKYAKSERLPDGTPVELQEEIDITGALMQMVPSSQKLAQYYRAPQNRSQQNGVWPATETTRTKGVINPYEYKSIDGERMAADGKSRQEMAASMPFFIDEFGKRQPLKSEHIPSFFHNTRRFAVVPVTTTGPDGDLLEVPGLQAIPRNSPGYGMEMLGGNGPQPLNRNAAQAALYATYNGVVFWANAAKAALGEKQTSDVAFWAKAYHNLENTGLSTAADVERHLGGDWTDGAVPDLERGAITLGARGPGPTQERINAMVQDVHNNLEGYKAAAKQGDVKSRLALEMYNAHQGNTGRGFLERYADRFKIYQDASTFNPSENVEAHGMFGSAEGLGTLFGDMTGFLLPQKAGATLLAQALLKTGAKSLVTRGIINGMTPQLSSLGQRTVAVGSASIPSLTMGQIVYQSARDVGYSHDQAKVQAIVALPIMGIAEMAIGRQWMIRSYMDKGGANVTRDKISEWLSRKIPERMSPLNKALMINSNLAKWWAKEPAGRFGGWAKNSLEAMYTEGKQEGFEEGGYALLEWATDWMTNENRFEKSRPEDYSFSARVLESAVGGFVGTMPMAMLNNGRSRPNPYDKGVAGAVAEGKGKEILDRAATMQQAGTLTEDDVNVLTQDVRLSESIMREFNVADPKTLNLLLQEQDMVTEYAQRRMEMEGINKQLADLNEQPLAEGQTAEQREAEKAELEKSLEVNKQAVAKILDGTELLNRFKQRAMLINSIDAKDEGFANSEQVDVITKRFTDWTAAREARIEEVNLFRQSIGTELSDAIDNLSTAKTSKILDAIIGYRQVTNKVLNAQPGNAAMTREEVQEGYTALANAKQALIADLAKMEALSDTSPNTSFDEAHAAEDPSGALEFEQWITSGLNPQRINALPESDERSIAFRELQILNDQMSMFGKTPAERDAVAQQYMPAAELEGKRSQADLLAEFLKSHPTGDNASVALFRGAIERFKLTETPSIADIQTLASLINLAKSNKEVFKHYSTTMHQVAEKFFGDEKLMKAGSAQSGNAVPPAFAQFKQEKSQVYDPAATIDANQFNQELTDIIADLERQLERMEGMVNKRKEQLDQIRRVDLMLRGSLLLKLAGTAGKLSTKPEFIETVKLMQAELDAFASTPGAIPNDNYEVLVNRAEDMVSELLVTGDETGIALIKETYGDLLNGQLKSASNYYETKSIDNASFPARFNEELFLDDGQKPSIVKAMAGFQYMVGWVSRLSRNRHATVLDAYARFVGTAASTVGYAPNEEQQQRVIEASSFLSNPDHDLTHKLTTIVAPLAQGAIIIPRAITIPGMPGVGKTKMLIPAIVNTVANIKGRKLRVGIIAPGTKNVTELSSAIVMSTKEYTHEPVHITDMSNPPKDLDLIIYDEAHVMDGNAVLQMKGMMEKLPETGALMLGDPAQVPSLRNMSYTFPVQRASMRTAPLQVSFRHNNAEVLRSIDALRSYIASGTQNSIVLPASHYTKNNHGVRYMSGGGISSIYNAFGAHLSESVNNSEFSGDAILIVKDEAQRQEAILAMAKISAFTPGHEARILTMDGGEHSVLGLEANVAFVALDPAGFDNAFGRFLYTAISRGKNGAVALLPNGQSSEVDKIMPIPSDGQSLNEISSRVRGYLSAVHRDLAPRVPADVVPTAPTAPAPPTTAPTDPNAPVVQKGRAPGAMVQVNSKFKKSKQGRAMQDLYGEYLTVVEDDGKVTKVRRQNGDELRIKNSFLKNAKGTPVPTADPNDAEPTTDNEEEPVDDKEGENPIPEDAPAGVPTRVSKRSDSAGTAFISSSASFRWTPKFPNNETALSITNKAFVIRMGVMKAIWSDPGSFTMKLVKRVEGEWTGDNGAAKVPGVEVHVANGAAMVNRILKENKMPQMTQAELEAAGYTMVGSLFMNTLAQDSPFKLEMDRFAEELFANEWEEGKTIAKYSNIPVGELYEGVRNNVEAEAVGDYEAFIQLVERRGLFVTDPVMAHAGSPQGAGWTRKEGTDLVSMPAIVVEVSAWDGAPATKVFMRTKEADSKYYQDLIRELDNVTDEIAAVPSFDRDNIEKTKAFGFIQWNRSVLIKDGQFVVEGLNEFLTINEKGKPQMLRGTRAQGMTPLKWANDLRKAVELVRDSEIMLTKAAMIGNRSAGGMSIIDNTWDLIPSTDRVNLPEFAIGANSSGVIGTGVSSAPYRAPVRRRAASAGDTSRTESQEAAQNYYRKVFGDRFVDNQLDFRSNLQAVDGTALHGVMENGYITLNLDAKGRVLMGVARHEAVHRVLDTLLDDQSRMSIINEASRAYAEKYNIPYWQVTDEQANEFIAEQYESPSYDTSTFFGRFMQWFRAMLGRWGMYSNRIGELLYRIENGEFRGAQDHDLGGRTVVRNSVREDGELPASFDPSTPAPARRPDATGKKRSVNEDMNVLSNIFGSHATAVAVVDDTVREIIGESLYAPPVDSEFGRSLPTLSQAATKVLQGFAARRQRVVASLTDAEGNVKSFDNATKQDVLAMTDAQWSDYVAWYKGDPQVFKMITRVALPNADITQVELADAVEYEANMEIDVEAIENSTANAHDTNENLNPFKRQSDLSRLSLQSMSLIQRMPGGQNRVIGDPYDVDLELMTFLVQQAAQFSIPTQEVSTIESLAESVRKAMAVDPESKEAMYLNTFYKRYLDPDGFYLDQEGNQLRSYAYMTANAGWLLSQYTPNTKEFENIDARIDAAERVLGNVVRMLAELSASNRWLVEHYQGEGTDQFGEAPQPKFNHKRLTFDAISEVLSTMKTSLRDPFFANGPSSISLDNDFRSKWAVGSAKDKATPQFKVTEEGVLDGAGNMLVRRKGLNFSISAEFKTQPEAFAEFFEAIGYPVSARTIDHLLKANEGAEKTLLPSIVGMWAYSIHAGIHRVETGKKDSSLFSNKTIASFNDSYGGVGEETVGDIADRRSDGFGVDEYPMPSMFFALNRALATVENRSKGASYMQRMVGATGKTIYATNLGTAFSKLLPGASQDSHSSKAMEMLARDLAKRDPALLSKEGVPLIPLLDPSNSTARISNVFLGSGVSSRTKETGKNANKLSQGDAFSIGYDLFVRDIMSSRKEERLSIAGTPFGDRDAILLYQLDIPTGDRNQRLFNKTNGSITVNKEPMAAWLRDMFTYRDQVAGNSVRSWAAFFGLPSSAKASEVLAKLNAAQGPGFKYLVKASPLLAMNSDYMIDGDKVSFGHAIMMTDSSIYSRANRDKMLKSDKGAVAVMDEIMEPYFKAFEEMVNGKTETVETKVMENGVEVVKSETVTTPGIGWQHPAVNIDANGRRNMMYGYFVMSHLVNNWVGTVIDGGSHNYKNAQDYIKRSVTAFSPGHEPLIGGQFGMPLEPRIAVFSEMTTIDENGNSVSHLDGQGYTTPWGWAIARRAFGGQEGLVKASVNKRIISTNSIKVKYSEAVISPELYGKNLWLQQITQRSLMAELTGIDGSVIPGTPLLDAWNNAIGDANPEAFAKATDAVMEKAQELGVSDQLVHLLTSESNVKMGLRGVNQLAIDTPLVSLAVDSRFWRLQTVLERTTDPDEMEAPYFTQLSSLFGVSESEASRAQLQVIREIEQKISENYLNKLAVMIQGQSGTTRTEKVQEWMRGIGLRKMSADGRTGQFVDMLTNPNSDINNPILRPKLVEFLANELSRNGINPKMHGQMFTQVSAYGLLTPEVTEQVVDPSEEELANYSVQRDVAAQQSAELEDQTAAMNEWEAQNPAPASQIVKTESMRELLPPRIENGQYMPGEIMIKFVHAATFGITDPSMPIDAMKEQIFRDQGEAGLAAFERYLNVFVTRTPSSGLGSGQWMKIVGFINDSGNSIYTPAGMNVPTGGDFDGDQLSVYFRNVKAQVDEDDGSKLETIEPLDSDDPLTVNQANIMNALWQFYQDPANAEMIMASTGTKDLVAVAEELMAEFPEVYGADAMRMELFTPSHNSLARKMASDGAQLIGIGAQHMKAYGYMMEAALKTMDEKGNSPLFDGWMPQAKDSTGRPVMANINQLLNGMLDNTKLMVMGQLGVNSYNVNLLMGAIINGASMKEAFLMLKDPIIQDAVRTNQLADSYSMSDSGVRKKTLQNAIAAKLGEAMPPEHVVKAMKDHAEWKRTGGVVNGVAIQEPDTEQMNQWLAENPNGLQRIRGLKRLELNATIGEASSALSRVFSINTKGIPHSLEAMKEFKNDTQKTLGVAWAGLANNAVGSGVGEYNDVIDARGIMEQIPSMIGFYGVAEWGRQTLSDSILLAHHLVDNARTDLIQDLGMEFMPNEAGRDWENLVEQALIVGYLNTAHGNSQFRLTRGMEPISLSGPGGHYRYVMEFPGFLKAMMARVERLKNSDPRKILMKQNEFLNSLRIVDKGTPRLEVPKARKIMNDVRESEAVRRAAERLDEIFTGDVANGLNVPMSQMVTLYSMMKDKFAVGSASIARFVPIQEYLRYDSFVNSLHAGVVQYGKLHQVPLNDGSQININKMLDIAKRQFVVGHPRMLPWSAKSAKMRGARYYAEKETVGSMRTYSVFDVNTGELVNSPWSQLGTVIDLAPSSRPALNVHKRWSKSDYDALLRGMDVVIPIAATTGWIMERNEVALPTGQSIKFTKSGDTITLDASTLTGSHKLRNNEDPALANNILKVDSKGFAKSEKSAYGPGHMELKGKQLKEALKVLQSKTEHPMYRQLAEFLGEQLQIHDRDSYVANMRARGRVAGRITSTGDIMLSDGITQLDAEHTLLHEALHRFLMGVMNAPEASLNAWEAEFRKKVETIFNEVKALDPNSDHYGMKDVHEFLAETLSNPDFQQHLRSLAPGSKQNIFWRIINAIRSLFPGYVRNDYVNRITSLSYDYIKRSSRSGIDRMPMGEAFRMSNAAQHGLSPQFKPVTDIRDLVDRFQTDPKAFITHEERQASQYVERLFNRLDRSRIAQELDGIRFSIDGMTDTQIREYLRKNVMPKVSTSDAQTKLKVMDVMNMAGDLEQNWNTKMVFADGNPMTTKETAKWFKEASGHRTGAIYLQYTDLKDPNTIITTSDGRKIPVSELGIKYVPGFDGFNPIVQVYVDGNGKKSVSLLDPTTRGNPGGDTGAGPYLLSVYMHGPFQSALKKLRTHNSSSGARTFLMGLTAMAMKQANPNISFHRIKALSLKDGKDGGVWMSDFIHEVRLLKNIPAFMNEIPDNIKAVLNDETLFDMDAYNQPFLQQYIEFLRTSGEGGSFTETAARDRLRTAAEKAMFSEEGSNANLLDAIRYRQRMMQKDYKQAYLVTDPEYIMLAHLVEDMNQHGRTNPNSIRDTSMVGHLLKNTHNIQSDVVQTVVRKTEQAVMKLAAKNGVFRAEMTARIKALEEKSSFMKVPGGVELADRGWKRFEAMWKLSGEEGVDKVYRKDGTELIGAHTNTLHWNKNDPATAAKLKAGKLTQAELDFANYALDEIHKAMVDKTVHDYKMDMRHWDPVTGIFDEALARKEAEAFVTKHYPRGWVPVVRRPASEAVFNLKFKEAFSTSLGASANMDAIYAQDADRVSGENSGEREKGRVSNTYGSELEIHEPLSKIGGSTRLRRMGLEIVDGKLISEADERNMASTMNLEIILNYVRLATDRQIIHEEETVPVYNGARALLLAKNLEESVDQRFNLKSLEDYAMRMIYNEPIKDTFNVMGVNPAPIMNMAISASSFIGVAWNWKVALASGVMNNLQMLGFSIASSIADDGLFSAKHFAEAVKRMASKKERDKMAALMEKHFINEWQQQDLADSFNKSHTRKLLFSGHAMNIGNFWTDNNTRGMVMMAQMLKDGSWDAYSLTPKGEVVYDEKKDRRWYGADGKLTEDGGVLIKEVKRRLIEQGVVDQKENEPLRLGYDLEMGRTFKWIADKYIIGGMDASQKANLSSAWYGRMFTTFKTYMMDRIYNWHGRDINSDAGGRLVMKTDASGKKMAVWERREITSYVTALGNMFKMLSDAREMGTTDFKNMRPADKRALAKLSYDAILCILCYLIYNGLKDDDDEDSFITAPNKQSAYTYERKMFDMLKQIAWDGAAGSAPGLVYTMAGSGGGSAIPVLNNAWRLMNVPLHPEKALYFAPGGATFADIYDLVSDKTIRKPLND